MKRVDREILHQHNFPRSSRLIAKFPNLRKFWILIAAVLLAAGAVEADRWTTVVLATPALAQAPASQASPVDPLPPDTGVNGLKQMLVRLQTTARLMQTTAHPDDEDGGMLTLESRGHGVTTVLMTLTRGEGGQNKVGSNLFDVLGVLRTLELTASDRYYGVEQRFSRVADFGYSKNPEETFQKWGGHDIPLSDMVRVIRSFHPDVLIARFSGTERDGHGHHQASAILTKEAFRAAADPNRFPEQIKEGLLPWQARKLYIGNVCGFGASSCPPENYTVRLNTGQVNPLLGMSYIQFAMEGLRHQLSQGAGGWSVEPGDRYTFYKLVDSVLPSTTDKEGHEKDLFDGIDTSWQSLSSAFDAAGAKELVQVRNNLAEAAKDAEGDPGKAATPLLSVINSLNRLESQLSNNHDARKQDVLARLHEKESQARAALDLALNLSLRASLVSPPGSTTAPAPGQDPLAAISPGQKFTVKLQLHNGSTHPVQLRSLFLEGQLNHSEASERIPPLQPDKDYQTEYQIELPPDTPATRPALHRNDPERDAVYAVDNPKYQTLPFPPPAFRVSVHYDIPDLANRTGGVPPKNLEALPEISTPVLVGFADEKGAEQKRPLAIVPAFSVELEPGEQVIPIANGHERSVKVGVSANLSGAPKGSLRLEAPSGWQIEPKEIPVELHQRGERKDIEFKIIPGSLQPGRAQIRAVLTAAGKAYSEGYTLVTREDLASAYYYQPALQRVSIVDVKVPQNLKVAYIPGAGDEIPTVLQQIGIDVTVLPAEKLASEDLSRYGTIVLGIRAYDTQKEVAANNKKLLDYVSAGGTLIVQYNAGAGDFNSGHFTPYPAAISRGRVSVEEAPVEILDAGDSVFRNPNQITQRDFDGWVQERGLYFMDHWDSNFKPLLSSHDPGEPPLKGGLLRAQYGKGTYIYTGYAFFRQLPAGVPGAIRLYVNLLNAGH
ncbi:MAG TPA: PIG-L family deacetylase [Terriglobales bacterium]|jgi:LmbE family N-acetylglucosaminyl deacetylase|nr:PIG-L family deacetylase [Terriglobales bacterium]